MAYTTSRIWYGPEGYQHATWYRPGTPSASMPCIVYRPGGGWAGADVADLESRFWWSSGVNSGSSAYQEDYHVFVLQTASIGYNRAKATGLTAWADATAYALGDYRSHGGRLWTCIDAHTSVLADNEPGVGTTWETKWREVGRNESGQQQVASLGETTPGGLDEMVTNVQQFIGWLRRNAATFDIDPDKICLAGASAGGQMAGCAAYAEEIPWARAMQVYGATRGALNVSCRPNALLLSISPVDFRQHTTYGLLNGLYGEDRTNPEWVALPDADKDAMSPQRVLQRTGLSLPTYLDYAFGTSVHGDGGADSYGNGSPYHHPDNGWAMINVLASARPTGFGRSDCRFVEWNVAGAQFVSRSSQTSAVTNVGATTLLLANHQLEWLASVLA